MSDKEKIRAEIERRLKRENEILWNAKLRGTYASPSCEYNLLTLTSIRDFINSLPEEPSCPKESDDLDKLMKEVQKYYSDNFDYITSDQPTLSILTNIARYFTEWQKNRMMKDAVEGEVVKDISNKLAVTAKINLVGFKFGQKVKIIILPVEKK